jgi:hypothetical protein
MATESKVTTPKNGDHVSVAQREGISHIPFCRFPRLSFGYVEERSEVIVK